MKTVSENKCFEGVQAVHEHASPTLGCNMRFGVFTPPGEGPFQPVFFLSGLTCTEQNFVTKAGAQRTAAELGQILIAPDTSPRGDDVPDAEDEYDFGKGAGFYLDATQQPWSKTYRMESYIRDELWDLVAETLPADMDRAAITGHSMGGHGALTLHLKNPDKFKAASAFSPVVAPIQVPWGKKAFTRYLGENESAWKAYDSCALLAAGRTSKAHILIDQGTDDQFLEEQLQPERIEAAAHDAGQKLTVRRQIGYDHSYFFIATFIEDHLRWLAD